jgi:predicted GIY-YIG superfamily endonuclease
MNLTEAAAGAPHTPGVYFFLGSERDFLYVGKALDLHRRLADHARDRSRTLDIRRRLLLDAVREVHWEESPDEHAAAVREADLIVMLRPAYNASHSDQDRDHYLVVTHESGAATFELTGSAACARTARAYGTFPHLAKGASSTVAKRTKAGFAAFLRLLWAASPGHRDSQIPKRIAGSSPPAGFEAAVAPAARAPLHDYLAGRSLRLLPELQMALSTADFPSFTRFALERDADAARDFFECGPRHVRRLRMRHALAPGPVTGQAMASCLVRELCTELGNFRAGIETPDAHLLGRRTARQHELRERLRG